MNELRIHVVTQPALLLFLGRSTYHLLGEERARTSFPYGSMVRPGSAPPAPPTPPARTSRP